MSGDTWSVEAARARLTVRAMPTTGSVLVDLVDLDYTPGGVTIGLGPAQALSLAGWLALGQGYALVPMSRGGDDDDAS